MNNLEDYQNLIEVLKHALMFYANEKNYIGNPAMINVDQQGSQARFALNKIEEIEKINEKMKSGYINLIEDVNNYTSDDMSQIIKNLKKINDGN